jgi:hypothetical protein
MCPRVAYFSSARLSQDEFRFYMEDAASKLLVVPVEGNAAAEKAAAELGIPVISIAVSWSKGGLSSTLASKLPPPCDGLLE